MALHRTTPGLKNSIRSLSPGCTHHAKPRPASALGHPSLSPFAGALPLTRGNSLVVPASGALPLTRGNSLVVPASKDTQGSSTDDAPPLRRPRVQSDGSRRLSPPQSPSPRGLTTRQVLPPVSDDFNLDGVDDSRSNTPLRRKSVRIASFISRFGQDAARRLTKSPTPSPLSAVASPDCNSAPRPTIRHAKRQSGSFGVTDDGSDAESSNRFYHDNTRRRRTSCGSIVEVAVRNLYAENADTLVHSDNEDEPLPKDAPKPTVAVDLLCLVPDLTVHPSNSASDLSSSGLDSSPSSPPGLSRSSSQWTPPSDSVTTLSSPSPCSTLPIPADTAESLLLAASQLLNAHGMTLLHHAGQLSEASTSLRELATQSLAWSSRLMAVATRSTEVVHLGPMFSTQSPSQTPTPRASTDALQDGIPAVSSPPPSPARRSTEHRLSQRSTNRNSWILKPVRHSSLLVEAERLASLGWSRLQAGERVHRPTSAETGGTFSDDYVVVSGSGTSASPEPISPTSPSSMAEGQREAHDAYPPSLESQSDESSNSQESTVSDDVPEEVPSLLPPIDLTAPTPRDASPVLTTREAPVSEPSWNDSSTEILVSPPDLMDGPDPGYTVTSSTTTLSPTRPSTESRSAEQHRSTPSFQIDDLGVARAPFVTMVNQPPLVPDVSIYTNPEFARTSIAPPTAYATPLPPTQSHKSETDLPRLSAPSRLKRRLSTRRGEPDRSGSTTPRRWFRWPGRAAE